MCAPGTGISPDSSSFADTVAWGGKERSWGHRVTKRQRCPCWPGLGASAPEITLGPFGTKENKLSEGQ